ncbi:asparagine synthase-related protein [Streptomyces roseifaciens]
MASDRCDVLAEVIGAPVDERVLASRLLAAGAVHSLDGRSIRRGVTAVPPDHCLLIEPDGRAVVRRWWLAPEPTLPLQEGAAALRGALSAAVDSCTADGGTVSADLSGGLDSTSLCLLAARGPARLVTVHREATDSGNDDAEWARRAVAALPGAEHQQVSRDRIPLWFAEVNGSSYPPWEEPGTWVRDRARLDDLTRRMTAAGSRLHLTGYGGDELFTLGPRYLHDLVRAHPFKAPAYIRAYRLRLRQQQPLTPLLRALAEHAPYQHWLTRAADQLTTLPDASAPTPSMAWGPVLHMPPWATAEAVRSVQELLQEASEAQAHEATPGATEPLARQRAHHAAILYARATGSAVRRLDQATGRAGLPLAAPCLDDAVMNAALSVRLHDRVPHGPSPTAAKPVLTAAMRGIVPDPLLARTTKGDYSADFYAALRRHRSELLDLFEDSLLADMGLIDPAPLRAALLGLHPTTHILTSLSQTVACETWLRADVPGVRA